MLEEAKQQEPGTEQARQDQSESFKCPNCGGHQVFDPDTQNLKCEQCGSLIAIPPEQHRSIVEYDFSSAEDQDGRDWFTGNRVVRCASCGAQTVLAQYAMATRCSFCGSTQVVDIDQSPGIRPEAVVPFKLDSKKASELFRKWLGKKIFAPKAVRQEAKPDRFTGVYLPYWTYDSHTITQYAGLGGEYYYVTEFYTVTENGRSVQKTRQVRHTRWFPVSGTYTEAFDDILVQAGGSDQSALLAKLQPYNLAELQPYQPDFLSGYGASHYEIPLQDGFEEAKGIMDAAIRNGIRDQVHTDELQLNQVDTTFKDIRFKHILLPVWLSSFRFRQKQYRYLINGQTGRVSGTYPLSPIRIALAVIGGIILTAGIYWLVSFLTGV